MSIIIKHQEEKLTSLRGQKTYVEDALTHDLENWERKEYQATLNTINDDITATSSAINQAKEMAAA